MTKVIRDTVIQVISYSIYTESLKLMNMVTWKMGNSYGIFLDTQYLKILVYRNSIRDFGRPEDFVAVYNYPLMKQAIKTSVIAERLMAKMYHPDKGSRWRPWGMLDQDPWWKLEAENEIWWEPTPTPGL
jgi:hypothetical protein